MIMNEEKLKHLAYEAWKRSWAGDSRMTYEEWLEFEKNRPLDDYEMGFMNLKSEVDENGILTIRFDETKIKELGL